MSGNRATGARRARGVRPLRVCLVAFNVPGYRSLALGYLRAYAEADPDLKGRVAFETFDLDTSVDPTAAVFRIAGAAPDVVAFSTTCWNAHAVHAACRLLRGALPDALLVLGGPEAGPLAESELREHDEVDAVVRGEGESTFAELLRTVAEGGDLSAVRGITARRGGDVVSGGDREPIADLDVLPSPYLSGVMPLVEGSTYLQTYRGCPHRCAYCFEAGGVRGIRSHSLERVLAEIEFAAAHLRSFSFVDAVFNLTPDHLRRLSDALEPHASAGLRLHTVEVDIERVDAEAASLLRRAGVRTVETGPQSVGDRALAACDRSFDAERFTAGVAALRAEGIAVECDLILGLPGDGPADVGASLRFVLGLDPGMLQASTLRVLPGTALWERADELGLAFDPQAPHEVVRTPQMTFRDLRRAEVLAASVQRSYRARLARREA